MRKQRTGITKAGCSDLRFALVQGAWSAMRVRHTDPMVIWALNIAQRRNRKIAAVALARKLAGILFALLRDGSCYQPARGATSAIDAIPQPAQP
jgi:transposase